MRKAFLSLVSLGLVLGSAPRAVAIDVTPPAPLSAKDEADLAALENGFFSGINEKGAAVFVATDIKSDAPADMQEQLKLLDKLCGPIAEVQRTKTTNFGNRIAKSYYVAVQGPCMVVWDLGFEKRGEVWQISWFNFNTVDRLMPQSNWPE